ncbi:MAG: DUF433 domain-containing protein [Leptospiraceae bacterium]|nr:DUF433 domain-containing protein [Leptospiraceae bacterium]
MNKLQKPKSQKIKKTPNYISFDPDVRFGKPCIKGTRIAVVDILGWLAGGMSYEQILEDFPELKHEHILAALQFAAKRETITKILAA